MKERSAAVARLLASLELNVYNVGGSAAYFQVPERTFIDVTCPRRATSVTGWRVTDGATRSDHRWEV